MSSVYIEEDLSAGVRHVHRALASLQEELEAIDYYNQRADRSEDEELKAILIHNRDEEIEHASMLFARAPTARERCHRPRIPCVCPCRRR